MTTIGLEFALPPLLGAWIDRSWKFGPVGVIAGAIVGFTIGIMHLLKISRDAKPV